VALENSGLTCNKNGVPFDPLPPTITSGIRFGSAAATTRGFKTNEFKMVGNFIADVLDHFDNNISNSEQEKIISDKVKILCDKFPIY
jgi:glycine hydroxymethyltransferase